MSIDAVVRHLRLEEDVAMPLETRLESAAATLIDAAGLLRWDLKRRLHEWQDCRYRYRLSLSPLLAN